MPLNSTNVVLDYHNIVAGVPIVAPIPAFATSEVYVKYGAGKLLAVQGTDYTVALDYPEPQPPPTTQYYQTVTITPTAALLDKIALDGTNVIYIGRELPLTTDFSEIDAFTRSKLDVEFARTNMKIQQIEANDVTSMLPDPRIGNIHDLIRVNNDKSGYEFVTASGGGDMFRINNLFDVLDPVVSLANIGGQPLNARLTGIGAMSVTPGIMVHDGVSTFAKRTITGGAGVVITNPDGVNGNIGIAIQSNTYVPYDATLVALAALDATAGFLVETSLDVFTKRSLAAGTGITISNPAGTAGNPSIAVDQAFSPTWTGTHTFGNGTGAVNVYFNGAAPNSRNLVFQSAGVLRWALRGADATAEGGSSSGSNFSIDSYNDAGVFLARTFSIARATGMVTYSAGITVPTGGLIYGTTDILARANTWTAIQTYTAQNIFAPAAVAGGQSIVASLRNLSGTANTEVALEFTPNTVTTGTRSAHIASSSGGAGGNVANLIFRTSRGDVPTEFMRLGDGTSTGSGGGGLMVGRVADGLTDQNAGSVNVAVGFFISNTNIFARVNTWTGLQTFGPEIYVNGAAGASRGVRFQTSGSNRWQIIEDSTAEGGANAGSNLAIYAFSDAAGFLASYLSINRATGLVSSANGFNASTGGFQLNGISIFATTNTWTGANTWTVNMTLSKASPTLVVDATSGNALVQIRGVAGTTRAIQFLTGSASERWRISVDTTAEGGSNAGSNFSLGAYSDAGAFIDNAISIGRSNGDITFNYGSNFNFGSTSVATNTSLYVRAPAGQSKSVAFMSGNSLRLNTGANTTAESGANAGSDYNVACYTDAGAYIGQALIITRATMKAVFAGDVDVNGSSLTANNADIVVNATGANNGFMRIQRAAGQIGGIAFRTGTTGAGDRWRIQVDSLAESGANAGTNFALTCYTDAGASLFTIMSIVRSTGVTTFLQGGGLVIGAATGGAKGVGTINAVGVYDDNVLLTCYVLEAANENKINLDKWDSYNYGRPHAPARKFAQRTHVLDVDKYIAEWKETGVLPGMPDPQAWADAGGMSTGDMIQRLWETVELLAVHIDQVNERAKAA